MRAITFYFAMGAMALSLITLSSCVDDSYDLSKDIDLTVNLGGDITVPGSSVDDITLKKIFDLEEGSLVQAVGADNDFGLEAGDYVLQKKNDAPFNSDIHVEAVDVQAYTMTTSHNLNIPVGQLPMDAEVSIDFSESFQFVSNQVTPELTDLKRVVFKPATDQKSRLLLTLSFELPGVNGAKLEGGKIEFPDFVKLSAVDGQEYSLTNERNIQMSRTMTLPFSITVYVDELDVTNHPGCFKAGDKTTGKNGTLDFESTFVVGGKVRAAQGVNIPSTGCKLNNTLSYERTPVAAITGKVDPDFNIEVEAANITDVPDFLKDDEVVIDLKNPQIYFTVDNSAPAGMELIAKLISYRDGKPLSTVTVGRGTINGVTANGTAPIEILKEGRTQLCLSRTGESNKQGTTNIAVPDLNELIKKVPEKIELKVLAAKLKDEEVTVKLGSDYNVVSDYEIVAPLAFNENMYIVYKDTLDGWNEDIKDVEIKEAVATLDVDNTIPMRIDVSGVAIDVNGKVIPEIDVAVDGSIAPCKGNEAVSTRDIKINMKSATGKMKDLDGLQITFKAYPDKGSAGQQLNENQKLHISNLKLSIKDGVKVDLN